MESMLKAVLIIYGLLISQLLWAAPNDPILERYIDLALTQNPRVAAAQSGADAALQRLPQAGALPQPMLGFGVKDLNLDGGLHDDDMTGRWVSLEQPFPFPGTLRSKQKAARGMSEMAAADADETRAMLTLEVKEMYYEWAYLRAAQDAVRASKNLMQQSLKQTTTAYSVGMGSQTDVLRAQTEVAKFDLELAELAQKEESAVANLNICCVLPPGVTTTPPPPLSYEPMDIPYDSLLAMIEQNSPAARAADARVGAARFEVETARFDFYPGFTLGLEYMLQGRGEAKVDRISFMGGLTLPLYWKQSQSPQLAEKRIEGRRAEEERKNTLNDLRYQLKDLYAKTTSLKAQIEIYDQSLLPQAEQTVAAARAGYVSGKVSFMDLLSHQTLLLQVRRERFMKISDYNITWAKIEALTGQRIS
jgi:outer membrane protein, heavy metal efflux system